MARRPRTPRTPAPLTLWDDPSEPTWSVAELGEALGEALRRSFPDEVWVRGEIRNLSRGRTGMVWFDLVEPAPGAAATDRPPVATLSVVLFDTARRRVNGRLQQAGGTVRMSDGTEVRIRGRLGWWAPGGRLQLQMSDIDPSFTLGRLAADRERLLRTLAAEGLLTRQQALPRPLVPLRIGLVTSAGSAAEHDVLDELRASGIGFRVVRADVRVQGTSAPRSVARGLRWVASRGVDVVLLVRGGGATTDLAAFDSEPIARAIAGLDTVVLTGIGHDVDRSVADEVAHAAYKTPTACAQAVIDDVRRFEQRLLVRWQDIASASQARLRREAERLRACGRHVAVATRHGLGAADRSLAAGRERLRRSAAGALARSGAKLDRDVGRLESGARSHLRDHARALDAARDRLVQRAPRAAAAAARDLDRIAVQLRALDPARTLARGWSITRGPDGAVVRSPADVAPGQELWTTVAGGELRSTVTATATTRDAGDTAAPGSAADTGAGPPNRTNET
ncbi:MAG TPA: exodeoxyribonuclease VII large subunit [Acidimicrobiales bacterium]